MHPNRKKIVARLNSLCQSANKELENRSNLTYPTVLNFVKGRAMRQSNENLLMKISLDLIEEYLEQQKLLNKRSKELLQPGTLDTPKPNNS